jgi:hypothetical protein
MLDSIFVGPEVANPLLVQIVAYLRLSDTLNRAD